MTGKITKIQRQILLLMVFSHKESIIDLDVIKLNVPIDIRTLQRDIKELTEAGFLKVSYDRRENRYLGSVFVPKTIDAKDEKKQRYFERIRHYEKMIFSMYECITIDLVEDIISELDIYEYMHRDWEKTGRFFYEPEYRGPDLDRELSADEVYFKLFPKAKDSDFMKDICFLKEIGFPIDYCEKLDVYYTDFPDALEA